GRFHVSLLFLVGYRRFQTCERSEEAGEIVRMRREFVFAVVDCVDAGLNPPDSVGRTGRPGNCEIARPG
ncbi:MAG TPA: hypothetical protein VGN31_17795, partial [Paraburkholderia sp.]